MIEKITEFEFDGQKIVLEKFRKFIFTTRFKDECLPMCMPHLRPLETILSSMINGYAPPDMTAMSIAIISEKEIDHAMIPAFRIMLEYYLPTRTYTLESLETLLPDLLTLYTIIYSQMVIERIMDFYASRKLTFFQDLMKLIGINLQINDVTKAIEVVVRRAAKRSIDSEIQGL